MLMPTNLYRPEIDGLRALAVLSVIINHFGEGYLPGGFLGVDIFFVISGYVITGSLLRGEYSSFTSYISAFYVRRIQRLLPTLLVVILIGSVGICFIATWQYANLGIRTGIAAAFGISNIYLYRRAVDYWGGQATLNPFTHTWSLGVEEQFYLIYPLFIWVIYRSTKVSKQNIWRPSIAVLWSLTLISLFFYGILYKEAPTLIFYASPFRFWEILSGGILFLYINQIHKSDNTSEADASVRSLRMVGEKKYLFALIALCLMLPPPLFVSEKYFSVPIKTFLVVFATILLIATIQFNRIIFLMFTNTSIKYIGKISYSLYLWHWPVLVLGRWMGFESNLSILVEVLITFTLSILSYRYIECYFRNKKWAAKDSKIVILSIVILCSVCLVVILSGVVARKLNKHKIPFEAIMIHNNYPCHSPKWTNDPIKDCLMPKNLMLKHIYLMGDSHSTNLIPSIENSMGKEYELRYLGDAEFTSSLFGDGPLKTLEQCKKEDCSRNEFQKRLSFLNKTLQRGDYVIFTLSRDNLYWPWPNDFESGHKRVVTNPGISDFIHKLTAIGKLINEKGGKFILVNGIPKVCSHKKFEIRKTISPENPCQGTREDSLIDREPLTKALSEVAVLSGAKMIDPHPYLCPDMECKSALNGRLIYFDGSPHFILSYPDPLKNLFLDKIFTKEISNKK